MLRLCRQCVPEKHPDGLSHFLIELVHGGEDFQRRVPADERGHAQIHGQTDGAFKYLREIARFCPPDDGGHEFRIEDALFLRVGLLCDRAANYGSIIIGVPDDGTIQFSRCARSDALPCGECRLGNCPFTYEPSRRGKLLPEKENSSKVLQKHSHSLDSLMNRNPFGFQGTCNLGLGVPGIDIERKDFEIKFR